ncbi:transmembrane protein [Cyclospora cayetanensis]|uniref:Transmembrane protein n=1 Tax=Cyclospora cayetanensis TaxID=88456 RepID=A0A1D3D2T4_9EIME|nr:transmembrane protein [Cyclospora cayetanensis]
MRGLPPSLWQPGRAAPSVPFGWRVYACLSLLKLPPLLQQRPQQVAAHAENSEAYLWECLAHRRLHLPHLAWARASTQLQDVAGRVLSLLQLRSIRQDLTPKPYTQPILDSLHKLYDTPPLQEGLYSAQHIYECKDGLSGVDASEESERRRTLTFASEQQLRFLCRSNSVHRRCFLLTPRKDTAEDLLLPPELLLPMTDQQELRTFRRFKQRRHTAAVAAAAAAELLAHTAASAPEPVQHMQQQVQQQLACSTPVKAAAAAARASLAAAEEIAASNNPWDKSVSLMPLEKPVLKSIQSNAEELSTQYQQLDTEGEDMVEWLLRHKENLPASDDASFVLDRPFYDDYLKDWAYLHLPEGEFAAAGALPASAAEGAAGPPDPAVSMLNRDPKNPRGYSPGFWLYKPETQLLYRDKETGGLLMGNVAPNDSHTSNHEGANGRRRYRGRGLSEAEMKSALLRMEMALEEWRRGGLGSEETDETPDYIFRNGRLQLLLSPEERLAKKWTLPIFQEKLGELSEQDDIPTGMEFLAPELLKGRPAAYRRLVRSPEIAERINREFVQLVRRGEADPEDDPLRLSPKELKLYENYEAQPPDEDDDVPTLSRWEDVPKGSTK